MSLITDISRQAAKAANTLALLDTETKNQVLTEMAAALRAEKAFIIKENESDLKEVPDNVKTALDIHCVSKIEEVLALALVKAPVPHSMKE